MFEMHPIYHYKPHYRLQREEGELGGTLDRHCDYSEWGFFSQEANAMPSGRLRSLR